MEDATSASYSVAIGHSAAQNITTGVRNVIIGYQSGVNCTGCNDNVMVGERSGYNTTGHFNVAIGRLAGYGPAEGSSNISIGDQAMYAGAAGSNNIAIGKECGASIDNCSYNVGVGYRSNYATNSGANNVAIGMESNYYNTGGNYNICIGSGAGPKSGMTGQHNRLYIGAGTTPQGEDSFIYGDMTVGSEKLVFNANVGIGTTNPIGKFHIYKHGAGDGDPGGEIILSRSHTDTTSDLYGSVIWSEYIGSNNCLCFSSQHGQNVAYNEQMVLTHGGKVGIGTTSPQYDLDIGGSSGGWISVRTDMGSSNIGKYAYGMGFWSASNNYGLAFFSGGNWKMSDQTTTPHLFISSHANNSATGNIGIGTTSPEYLIDLKNDSFVTENPVESDAKYIRFMCANGPAGADNGTTSSGGLIWKTNYGSGYTKTSAKIIAVGTGNYFRQSLAFYTNGVGNNTTDATEKMRIHENGNVGIGTTSPTEKLEVAGWYGRSAHENGGLCGSYNNVGANTVQTNPIYVIGSAYKPQQTALNNMYGIGYTHSTASFLSPNNGGWGMYIAADGDARIWLGAGNGSSSYFNSGNVGIGTTTPKYPLEIQKSVGGHAGGIGTRAYNTASGSGGNHNWGAGTNHQFSALFSASIASLGPYHAMGSDRRIKKNIIDVPDDLALEQVRNIPCRYYEYIDTIERGSEAVIGFIAQEVKEAFPHAVTIIPYWIPNEYRKLSNFTWEKKEVDSVYKLTTDIQEDVSGVKYRFYVNNGVSGNDEIMKEVIGDSDNTFTFDTSYNNVFCFGKEIDDFHCIDKGKIFTPSSFLDTRIGPTTTSR